MTTWNSKYFYGKKISDYGLRNGYVDYYTLASAFDAVINNNIMQELESKGFYFEVENGFIDNSEKIEELENKIYDLEELENDSLNDKIEELKTELEELEDNNGMLSCNEIFQYFIISDNGARILKDYTNEILFYCEDLDMYIWGVTHWGTSWDYVLTDIKLDLSEN